MATDNWTGIGAWDDHFNWSTNEVPTDDDDVVIDEPSPSGAAPYIYSGFAAVANSVEIDPLQTTTAIGFGGSLTIVEGLTLGSEIAVGGGGGGSLSVGGLLTDDGEVSASAAGTVTAPTIVVGANSTILDDGGTVTTTTLTNSGLRESGDIVGVYVDEAVTPTSGTLNVTGVFTNEGTFGVGDFGGSNVVTVGTLDNESAGQINIGTATVTVTTLTNAGATTGTASAGIGVDTDAFETGGDLEVTGAFTNTGDFAIGNGTSATTVTIGTLGNKSTGGVFVDSGDLTVSKLTNAGVPDGDVTAGILIDAGPDDTGEGVLTVTGTFTNTGDFAVGNGTATPTVNIHTLANQSTGGVAIDSGEVTVDTLTNAGAVVGDTAAGIGIDADADDTGDGSLTVTGTFTNTGDFAVGNGTAAPTVNIGTLANLSAGGVDIESGLVTVTTLTNAGVAGETAAGIGVDHNEGETGGGALTVTGAMTNTGDFAVGNDGLTSAATASVGTLDNASGTIDLIGGASAQATLEIGSTPTTWSGTISLSNDALLEMKDNGAIETIAADGGIEITGDQAFVADADATSSSSALDGLRTVDGVLALASGASATIDGKLTNNGLKADDGGLALDFDDGDSLSSLKVEGELTNNGGIGVGNTGDEGPTTLTLGGLDNATGGSIGIDNAAVMVDGNAINASGGTDLGIFLDVEDEASGGSLTVTGALTNSGLFIAGNETGDETTEVTLGSLDNTATGSIGFDDAAVIIEGALTNAGVGADNGIGLGNDEDSTGDCSLTVNGALTNSGDMAIGNTTGDETTTVMLASLDNTATGSIAIADASVTVKGNLTNAGAGTTAGIDDGLGVDLVDGASGGSLGVTGKLTNTGEIGFGNAADDGSTTITLGSLENAATGSIEIANAAVTVKGSLTNAGVGAGNGIGVGDEEGATGDSSLTVTKALTNSGIMDVGFGGGDATVSAASFTNSGVVDIDDGLATIAVKGIYTQSAGTPGLTTVDGTLSAATIKVTGGTIDGTGLIVGSLSNTGGDVQAGLTLTSPGTLGIGGTLPGSYTQGAKGKLSEVVAGAGAGQFGVLKVNGAVRLGGGLAIEAVNGFAFAAGQSFEIMSFTDKKLKGTFGAIDFGADTGNAHDVLIGGGLALVALYDNAQGQIDLDVVATNVSVATFEGEKTILDQIVTGFAVTDTAKNIENGLAKLTADASHINSIASSSGVVTVTAKTFTADGKALNEVVGGFAVSDTGTNVAADFAALDDDIAHVNSVRLTGASPVLDLTQAQAVADQALLNLISAPYVLNVTNGGATTTTGKGDNLTIDAVASGDDTITGGGSGEKFVFSPGFGQDTITDFAAHDLGTGHDSISLPAAEFSSFAALFKASSDVGNNIVITAKDGDTLTLDGLAKSELSSIKSDFKFLA